jgi:hypothetical protein
MTDLLTSPSLEVVFGRAENVVGRNVAGEFILVPIAASGVDLESIFHLNRVGSFIWECLDGRKNGEEIVTGVMDRFDVNHAQVMDDCCRFLSQLEAIGLCEGSSAKIVRNGCPRSVNSCSSKSLWE